MAGPFDNRGIFVLRFAKIIDQISLSQRFKVISFSVPHEQPIKQIHSTDNNDDKEPEDQQCTMSGWMGLKKGANRCCEKNAG